jgi:hypothetical protein
MPGRETVDVEDRVLVHRRGEVKAVGQVASAFSDFIGA